MFTGIVEKSVPIRRVADMMSGRRLTLPNSWSDLRNGESIAVNGTCLTVAEFSPGEVSFDVIAETLEKTNLGLLSTGDLVHVERSLRVGDRIDGHIVQGHVDGRARLVRPISTEIEFRLVVEAPDQLAKFLMPKGSVTLDGVSLTLAAIHGHEFEVALIPTTLQTTALGSRPIGWPLNFEADIFTKTVVSWLERREAIGENDR